MDLHKTSDVYDQFASHFNYMLLNRPPDIPEEDHEAYIKTIQYIQMNLYNWTYALKGTETIEVILLTIFQILTFPIRLVASIFTRKK